MTADSAYVETVRTSFPYPIARPARSYGAADAAVDRYREGLRLAENLIVLTGALALAWDRSEQLAVAAVTSWRTALTRGGVSLGHWVAVTREVAAEGSRRGIALGGLADAAGTRRGRRGLTADLNDLVALRNKEAHGGPARGEVELAERLALLDPALHAALSTAHDFLHGDLLEVERCALRRGRTSFVVRALRLRGDHPDFESTHFESTNALAEHTVLWRTGLHTLDLTPFVLVRDCPKCGSREVYFPDRLNGGSARFQSFDRRHELHDEAWSGELLGGSSDPASPPPTRQHASRVEPPRSAATSPLPQPVPVARRPFIPSDVAAPRPDHPAPGRGGVQGAPSDWPRGAPVPAGSGTASDDGNPGARWTAWSRRLAARGIDLAVSVGILFIATLVIGTLDTGFRRTPTGEVEDLSGAATGLVFAAWCVGSLVYEIATTARWGATVGKRALKLAVVPAIDQSSAVDRRAATKRAVGLVGLLCFPPINVLDALWPLWDDDRQALHDKLAGTVVVDTRRRASAPSPTGAT